MQPFTVALDLGYDTRDTHVWHTDNTSESLYTILWSASSENQCVAFNNLGQVRRQVLRSNTCRNPVGRSQRSQWQQEAPVSAGKGGRQGFLPVRPHQLINSLPTWPLADPTPTGTHESTPIFSMNHSRTPSRTRGRDTARLQTPKRFTPKKTSIITLIFTSWHTRNSHKWLHHKVDYTRIQEHRPDDKASRTR